MGGEGSFQTMANNGMQRTLLLVSGIAVAIVRNPFAGLILVLLAQFLPKGAKPAAKPSR